MPPILLRYLPAVLGLLGLIAGLWWFGHSRYEAGQDDVRAQWDAAIVAAQAEADRAEAEHARIAKELQSELTRKDGLLDAADSRGRDLAGKLRSAQARRCLPAPAAAAPGAAEPGGVAGDGEAAGGRIDAAVEAHFAACARDAERLDGWRGWWRAIQATEPSL